MLNFGASKPRVKGGPGPRGPPWIQTWLHWYLRALIDSQKQFPEGYEANLTLQHNK